jgi:hypothetical protein
LGFWGLVGKAPPPHPQQSPPPPDNPRLFDVPKVYWNRGRWWNAEPEASVLRASEGHNNHNNKNHHHKHTSMKNDSDNNDSNNDNNNDNNNNNVNDNSHHNINIKASMVHLIRFTRLRALDGYEGLSATTFMYKVWTFEGEKK